MGQPYPALGAVGGMAQDVDRLDLPDGVVWNLMDLIPNLDAILRKRGGWTYTCTQLGASTTVPAIFNAEFTAATKLCAIGGDANLYTVSAGTPTSAGAALSTRNLYFHRSKLIIPHDGGTTAPKYYDGTTLGNLAGSPPAGIYGGVFKDRSLLGNSSALPTRLWYSGPGDPTLWDTTATGQWYDTSSPITGLATLRSAVLVFHSGSTERLRGSTFGAGGDIVLEPIFEVGCVDNRSIQVHQDTVLWADTKGVYQSDGAVIVDLTASAAVKNLWQTAFVGYPTSARRVSGAVFRNHYIVTVTDATTQIDCFVFNLRTRQAFRFSNFLFYGQAARVGSGAQEEVYFGHATSGKLVSLSPTWSTPAASDGSATTILPYFETGMMRGWTRLRRRFVPGREMQTWRYLYPTYDLRDGGSAPTLQFSYVTSPEVTSYTALATTAPPTTKLTRKRIPIRIAANALGVKVAQQNASSDFRWWGLDMDYSGREGSRI